MITLTVLLLLALGAYRITRFIVIDTLFEGTRNKTFLFLEKKNNIVADKVLDLIGCTWCTGVWVSAVVYYIYAQEFHFLNVIAIAGLQGLLHALEPDE